MTQIPSRPVAPQADQPRPALAPESLDLTIETAPLPLRWALVAVCAAVVAAVVWSCVAHVPQRVTTTGTVSSLEHSVDVTAGLDGQAWITVEVGARVEAGDILGEVAPYDGVATVPVVATRSGTVAAVSVTSGQGVAPGDVLARIVTDPESGAGFTLLAFVPAAEAVRFTSSAHVSAHITDLATGRQSATPLTVLSVSDVPSTAQDMLLEGGSPAMLDIWSGSGGDVLYRVTLGLPTTAVSTTLVPQPGEPVTILNTYADPRPVELLFGS
jgi:biotin carboxyl carrier protein